MANDDEDPFDILVANVRKVLDALTGSRNRATSTLAKRRWQIRRVERALAVLTREAPQGWTPERRAAQSERLKGVRGKTVTGP